MPCFSIYAWPGNLTPLQRHVGFCARTLTAGLRASKAPIRLTASCMFQVVSKALTGVQRQEAAEHRLPGADLCFALLVGATQRLRAANKTYWPNERCV